MKCDYYCFDAEETQASPENGIKENKKVRKQENKNSTKKATKKIRKQERKREL